MKILQFLGEFALFRWLFDDSDRKTTHRPTPRTPRAPKYTPTTFDEEQDDYDLFDDLDLD